MYVYLSQPQKFILTVFVDVKGTVKTASSNSTAEEIDAFRKRIVKKLKILREKRVEIFFIKENL